MHDTHEYEKLSIPSTSSLKRFCMIKSFSFLSLMSTYDAARHFCAIFIPSKSSEKWKRADCAQKNHKLISLVSWNIHPFQFASVFRMLSKLIISDIGEACRSGGISLCLVIKMHSCLKTDIAVLERHFCWRAHCLPLFLSLLRTL